MSEEKSMKELEKEIAELKDYVFMLRPSAISPGKAMMAVRKEYRDKYFGTWDELKDGKTTFGPNGKSYSDYSAITDIIMKTTGLLFKYSYGKPNGGVQIQSLLKTAEDMEQYEGICDMVCRNLRQWMDDFTERGERHE